MFASFRRRLRTLNRIEVSQEKIRANFALFQKLIPGKKILPVLKSNAYGHGIRLIVEILKPLNPPYLIVDSYYEALQIWKVAPKQEVLVIGYNLPENYRLFDFNHLAVTIYDRPSLQALAALKQKVRIHLKINTGLNRQGLKPTALPEFLAQLEATKNVTLEGVCSHFASADEAENTDTPGQERIFASCLEMIETAGFTPKFIHLSNTAGALKTTDPRINGVRLGIGLYGHNPLSQKDQHFHALETLQPALRLVSTLINIHELKKGDKVGYGGTFIAPKNMRIGVVPVGYYEALPRSISNTGFFRGADRSLPILGRIHMNLTCFDLKNTALKVGDEIEVIGTGPKALNTVECLAKAAKTIPYEILVKLNESIRREIV